MEERYLAAYLRLSIEDGDVVSEDQTESDSIRHQRALIWQYRKEKDLYPGVQALELVDDGYSGTNFERPGIKRLLSLVRAGKICCIIVKDLSRFSRDYLEAGDYLEQIFPFMGVRFIAVNDGYDSDDYVETTGGIEVALKSLLYDLYSKDLSVKMRSALEVRRKRGDYMGPRPPFGYRFSEDKRVLAVDEEAARYVKRVFELACMGYSTGKIALRLNQEKVPTPGQYKDKDRPEHSVADGTGYWNSKKVRRILEDQVYLGTVVNARYRVTKIGGSQFERVPDDEQICVPGRHEAIVTEQDFLRASKVIQYRGAQRGIKHSFRREGIWMGRLRCGNCKRSLTRITSTTVPSFTCERARYAADSGCPSERWPEPEIEALVAEKVQERLGADCREGIREKTIGGDKTRVDVARSDETWAGVMRAGETGPDAARAGAKELDRLQRKLATLEKRKAFLKGQKHALYEQLKRGQIQQDVYLQKVERSREEEARLSREIRDAEKEAGAYREQRAGIDAELAGRRRGLTREVVEQLIDAVYVYEGRRVEIIWNGCPESKKSLGPT